MRGWIEDRAGRGGLRWRARHRGADGRLRSRSFARKVEAEAWLDEQRSRVRAGSWLDPDAGKVTFAEWFSLWLASKQRITTRTRFDYQGIYGSRLAATFGSLPLRAIDRGLVSVWVDGLVGDGLSPARIRKCAIVLTACLEAAVDEGLIGRNPAHRVELPRVEVKRKRFLSADEVARLAHAMGDTGGRALVLVAAYGGLRWGELAALRRDRCDLLRRRLIVDAAMSDVAGRLEVSAGNEEPFIPAYDQAVKLLMNSASLSEHQPLISEITDLELQSEGIATPRMLELATRTAAIVAMTQFGDRKKAFETLSTVWLEHPKETGIGLIEVGLVAASGNLDLAVRLCEVVEPHLPEAERLDWIATYFSLVSASLAAAPDAELEQRAVAKADQIRRTDGPHGIVVNFLINRLLAGRDPKQARVDVGLAGSIAELLAQHLVLFVSRKDNNTVMMAQSLIRTAEFLGRPIALRVCEDLLRADPSVVQFWLLRAGWLHEEGRADEALAGLRWLYHYAPGHPAILRSAEIAARNERATIVDADAVAGIPDEAAMQPGDGPFTRGLLALRAARYEDAAQLLAEASDRPDGGQLYYRALAELLLGHRELAQQLLRELDESYPDSTLSTNAAHFVCQLN